MTNHFFKFFFLSLVLVNFAHAKNITGTTRVPSSIQDIAETCKAFDSDCAKFKSIIESSCSDAVKIAVTDLSTYISKAEAVDEIANQFNKYISNYNIDKSERYKMADSQAKFRQCASSLRLTGDQYSF